MRTVQKTQSVRAIFTPKAKINNKGENARKGADTPRWAKFRGNGKHDSLDFRRVENKAG